MCCVAEYLDLAHEEFANLSNCLFRCSGFFPFECLEHQTTGWGNKLNNEVEALRRRGECSAECCNIFKWRQRGGAGQHLLGSESLLLSLGAETSMQRKSQDENQEAETVPYLHLPETTSILWDDNTCWERVYQTAPEIGSGNDWNASQQPWHPTHTAGMSLADSTTLADWQTNAGVALSPASDQAGDPHEEALTVCCASVCGSLTHCWGSK